MNWIRSKAKEWASGAAPMSVPPDKTREQLDRILRSSVFSKSPRHSQLLEFLVSEAIAGRGQELKETVVAMAVFGKTASFDPQTEAIVRVEVGRLRRRLQEFYASAAVDDPILIEIPMGAYAPVFTLRTAPPPGASMGERIRGRWVVTTAGILAVLLVTAGLVWIGVRGLWRSQAADGPSAGPPQRHAVAVLPFAGAAGRAGSDLFGNSLADNILSLLPSIPHVLVASRTSVFGLSGKSSDIRRIASELGVSLVLEGSVRAAVEELDVTARLIDARSGYQIWSGNYGRASRAGTPPLNDIAHAIVTDLHLKFAGQDAGLPERYRQPGRAWALYTEGLILQAEHDEASVRKSVDRFTAAVASEPHYAPALAAEAYSYVRLAEMHLAPARDSLQRASAAAARALDLDPELGEAHWALGSVTAVQTWDWQAAERHFVRAIQLKPGDPRVRAGYAMSVLVPQNRFEEASEQIAAVRSLDPLSARSLTVAGAVAFFGGDFGTALNQYQRALEIDDNNQEICTLLASAYVELSESDKALAALRRLGSADSTRGLALLGYTYGRMGKKAEARQALAELSERSKRQYVPPYDMALIHAALEEEAEALSWLRKAVEEHSPMAIRLAVDPGFRTIRSKPAFQQLVASMKLPAAR